MLLSVPSHYNQIDQFSPASFMYNNVLLNNDTVLISLKFGLVLAIVVSVHDFIQFLEASTPLQRNVSVKKLIISLNITGGINLKPVLVKESDHFGVGSSLFAGVVVGGTSTSHSPGLMMTGGRHKM